MRFHLLACFFTVAIVSGCNQQQATPSIDKLAAQQKPTNDVAIDQVNLCEVQEWMHDPVASICKLGQKVVYLPNQFGNEQLPILFAAVNCDLRYSVALTNGAVTCIYGPITLKPEVPKPSTPASGKP